MDFVDQEAWLLDFLKSKISGKTSIGERLSAIYVDEFQDTSPIQLALFMALHKRAEKSFWVGDPKQAIYGFRGTDPVLMNEVMCVHEDNVSYRFISKRSRERLTALTNTVFTRAFYKIKKEHIRLQTPTPTNDEDPEKYKGGVIEAWSILAKATEGAAVIPGDDSKGAAGAAYRLAIGVRQFLDRYLHDKSKPDRKHSDVAILCRTNPDCLRVATQLEHIGVRASLAKGLLAETFECRLALAALRYLADSNDTLAMAEIIRLTPDHPDSGRWLDTILADRDKCLSAWRNSAPFSVIDTVRDDALYWTPREALEFAIDASGVLSAIKTWIPAPALAAANLEALRKACDMYLDQCRVNRSSASIAGFLMYMETSDLPEAEGKDEGAVQVLTYHGAKGLEWPVVILYALDAKNKGSAFSIRTVPARKFNPDKPLADRRIHYWPNPLTARQTSEELNALLQKCPEHKAAVDAEADERRRLLYVGFTRVKDTLIFALKKTKSKEHGSKLDTAWLDELNPDPNIKLLNFPDELKGDKEESKAKLHIGQKGESEGKDDGEKNDFDITVRNFSGDAIIADSSSDRVPQFEPAEAVAAVQYYPARMSPSKNPAADAGKMTPKLIHDFKVRTQVDKNLKEYGHLGDAVHGFLGMDDGLSSRDNYKMAAGLLERFGVAGAISPDDMLAMRDRLYTFIKNKYRPTKIECEIPVTMRYDTHQIMQGWVDMLLKCKDGYVVIDHKTHQGSDTLQHARQFSPQLAAYRDAINQALREKDGKNSATVTATLLHYPVSGQIIELK